MQREDETLTFRQYLLVLLVSIPIVAVLVGLAGSIQFLPLAFPAFGYFLAAGALFLFVSRFENPWMKAAKSMLLPTVWGFALLSVLLFAINATLSGIDESAPVETLERRLLSFAETVPSWATDGWPKLATLIALVPVIHAAPTLALSTRYLWLSKTIRRLAGTLAFATSFSFFTNDAMLGKLTDDASRHVTIVWSGLKDEQRKALGEHLAFRIVSETSSALSLEDRRALVDVMQQIHALGLRGDAQLRLAREVGVQLSERRQEVDRLARRAGGLEPEPGSDLHERIAEETARLQSVSQLKLAAKRDAEELKAFEEALTLIQDQGRTPVRILLGAFFEGLMEGQRPTLVDEAERYLNRVVDRYLDRLIEPAVKRYATDLQALVHQRLRPGDRATPEPDGIVRETLTLLAVDRPRALLTRAETTLAKATQSSLRGIDLTRQAENDFQSANELLSLFGDVLESIDQRSATTSTAARDLSAVRSRLDIVQRQLGNVTARGPAPPPRGPSAPGGKGARGK